MQSTRFTSAEAYLLVKDVFIEVREELPGDNELESAENSAAVSAGMLVSLVHVNSITRSVLVLVTLYLWVLYYIQHSE